MKKFRVRFFGLGVIGECEIPFNHEPTVDEIEDMVAMYLEQGLFKLQLNHLTNKQKYDIEVDNEKLQSKTLRKRNLRRACNTLQHRTNTRTS